MKRIIMAFFLIIHIIITSNYNLIHNSYNFKITHEGIVYNGLESDESIESEIVIKHFIVLFLNIEFIQNEDMQYTSTYYNQFNTAFVNDYVLFDYLDISISRLAPVIEFEIESISEIQEEIIELSTNDIVLHIFTRTEYIEFQLLESFPPEDLMTPPDGGGTGGSGLVYQSEIKVGLLDGGKIDQSFAIFQDIDIFDYNDNISQHWHTTGVAALIANEFGNNSYLSFHVVGIDTSFIEGVDWLIIDQEVDIINMSRKIDTLDGVYGFYSMYTDFIVYTCKIPFIKSSGNIETILEITDYDEFGNPILESVTYNQVTAPGTGFNVFTVGGINSDNSFYQLSRYLLDNDYSNFKPNIVAYNYDIIYGHTGTSYAAPRVTGNMAKFMSYFPDYKGEVEFLYSVFLTSGDVSIVSGINGSVENPSGMYNKIGSGSMDTIIPYEIMDGYWFSLINHNMQNLNVYSKNVSINENETITISIFSLRKMFYLARSQNYTPASITNYQVLVYRNGNLISQSSGNINFEMLRLTVTTGGLYQIKIVQLSPNVNSYEKIGFSYKIT